MRDDPEAPCMELRTVWGLFLYVPLCMDSARDIALIQTLFLYVPLWMDSARDTALTQTLFLYVPLWMDSARNTALIHTLRTRKVGVWVCKAGKRIKEQGKHGSRKRTDGGVAEGNMNLTWRNLMSQEHLGSQPCSHGGLDSLPLLPSWWLQMSH